MTSKLGWNVEVHAFFFWPMAVKVMIPNDKLIYDPAVINEILDIVPQPFSTTVTPLHDLLLQFHIYIWPNLCSIGWLCGISFHLTFAFLLVRARLLLSNLTLQPFCLKCPISLPLREPLHQSERKLQPNTVIQNEAHLLSSSFQVLKKASVSVVWSPCCKNDLLLTSLLFFMHPIPSYLSCCLKNAGKKAKKIWEISWKYT